MKGLTQNIKKYVVMDLENPNSKGNSICSIGICIVNSGTVVEKKYFLINPEDRFDPKNEEITGISKCMVYDKPNLKEIWPEIKSILTENIIIGHNITYDLSVLSKALQRYGIAVPEFRYICTLRMSKENIITDSYSLSKLLKKYNYYYESHNALEDAMACQFLFEQLVEERIDASLYVEKYRFENRIKNDIDYNQFKNINYLVGIIKTITVNDKITANEIELLKKWVKKNSANCVYSIFYDICEKLKSILETDTPSLSELKELNLLEVVTHLPQKYKDTTISLQVLYGILDTISCDIDIDIDELEILQKWLAKNDYMVDVYPYDKINRIVNSVLEDGIIDSDERTELLAAFKEVIEPCYDEIDKLDFVDKTFCLTGEFKSGSKSEIKEKIEKMGAISKTGVSSKLDYLFVGGLGSDAWKCGKVGGKILKAQELQEKGKNIKIIEEDELMKYI